jgi:hypothetical protein
MLITCRNCGETVDVPETRQPWRYTERGVDDPDGPSLLIIGRDHLLHLCQVASLNG